MPKFHLDTFVDLKEALQELGIVRVFDRGAQLAITASPALNRWISRVSHGVDIDVNEHGIVAAAGTAGQETLDSRPGRRTKFDRPFAFLLLEPTARQVLFAAWIADPSGDGGTP